MRFLAIVALGTAVSTAACASSTADPGAPGVDEIRTETCPTEFKLELEKPEIFARTPSKTHDGVPLSSSERGRIEDAMKQARRFRPQSFSFKLQGAGGAKCFYTSALSSDPNAPSAVLRGPSSKPVVDVTFGAFRWFAFPKTIAPEGLLFESKSRAGVFSQVPAGERSLLVKIGDARITNAAPPPRPSGPVAAAVADVESEDVLSGPGFHDDFDVPAGTPLEMVKGYIAARYADDPEIGDGYKFVEDARELDTDTQLAGTMKKDVAIERAFASIQGWFDEEASSAHMKRVRAALDKLAASGASFGFDGFEQNGCAAPTAFLLVIDAAGKHVYGIDLNPCSES
jgi:hypothetical protein